MLKVPMYVPATPLPHRIFVSERPGQFAFGYAFWPKQEIVLDGVELSGREIGYWRCDLMHDNRLTWSDKVYQLFGLPIGSDVARGEAVRCYSDGSRVVLERLRSFSITNQCGFILDARISYDGTAPRSVRILSAPILRDGRVVAIHGLKRAI